METALSSHREQMAEYIALLEGTRRNDKEAIRNRVAGWGRRVDRTQREGSRRKLDADGNEVYDFRPTIEWSASFWADVLTSRKRSLAKFKEAARQGLMNIAAKLDELEADN